jgi:hypothetical protein
MNVLIACEESQAVCKAFREIGHTAFSCDIQECSGGNPEWHIQDDVMRIINGNCSFQTADTHTHTQCGKWDLIIAHPPCTYLSNAGACRLFKVIDGQCYINRNRFEKGMDARDFFMKFYEADCEHIAIENPTPSSVFRLPEYTQAIQPYEYGEPYTKRTCLWLKGLPLLRPTEIVEPVCSWVSGGSKKTDGTPRTNKGMTFRDSKRKSKTFNGIARAMAQQWGIEQYHIQQTLF